MNKNRTLWVAGLTASVAVVIALSAMPPVLAQSAQPMVIAQHHASGTVAKNPQAKATATAKATVTPEPAPAATDVPASGTRTVTGIACIDADRNGICSSDEARVPNVIIRADSGAVAATDNSGTYTIDVPTNAALDVTIPVGYKSLDGNPRVQMAAADRLDIALVVNAPIAIPTIVFPTQPIKVELPSNFGQTNAKLDVNLQPLMYALAGLGAVLLLSQMIIGSVLRGIRKTSERTFEGQHAVWTDQRAQDVAYRLQNPDGWQMVAEQLVANTLSEPVAIDTDAGILDATSDPAPKFTLASRDGREFIFTIDPDLLKKQRLLQRGDKVVKLSRKSPHNQADMMMLWEYVQQTRRLWRLTPPANADWYIAVRGTARSNGYSIGQSRRNQLPPSEN